MCGHIRGRLPLSGRLTLLQTLQELLYLLAFKLPRWTRDTECIPHARVGDVAKTADRLKLSEVDDPTLVQYVRADVDCLHETKNERRRVRSRGRIDDVMCMEQLLLC